MGALVALNKAERYVSSLAASSETTYKADKYHTCVAGVYCLLVRCVF